MEQNQSTSLFQLNLDAQNSYNLRSAASWAKVLGIIGLIIGIICVIMGIFIQQAVTQTGRSYRNDTGFSASTLGNAGLIVYVVMGLIYIVSGMFALNGGNKINQGLKANDQAALNAGFAGVRNYFAFWTILMILFLLLILITLLGSLAS